MHSNSFERSTIFQQYKIVKDWIAPPHCSKLEIVLNENDTPQNQQFLLVYTLVLPKESRLQKSVDIQG